MKEAKLAAIIFALTQKVEADRNFAIASPAFVPNLPVHQIAPKKRSLGNSLRMFVVDS